MKTNWYTASLISACPILAFCLAPNNGMLHCNGLYSYYAMMWDSCTFYCNQGYEIQGPRYGICLYNTWSRGLPTCVPLNYCPDTISISNDTFIQLQLCTLTYLTRCRIYCNEDHVGDDVIYLCNVTSDPTVYDWVPIGGVHSVCERGLWFTYICISSV